MSDSRKRDLLALSIKASSVSADGNLTIPRTFGVYRLIGPKKSGREHRFGNHPVRLHELVRDFGGASLAALFNERKLAEELATLLNKATE